MTTYTHQESMRRFVPYIAFWKNRVGFQNDSAKKEIDLGFSLWLKEGWANSSHVVRILCVFNLSPAPKEGAVKPSNQFAQLEGKG